MKVEALTQVDRELARELWQKYQTHKHYQTPADAEIAAIYKRIAQGKTVIRALASIVSAGLNTEGLPKLAIARAQRITLEDRSGAVGRLQAPGPEQVALRGTGADHPRASASTARHPELPHPVGG